MASDDGARDFWRLLIAYFLPPVGVFMQSGVGVPLIINVVLTFFFFFPAQIHAAWVIATTTEDGRSDDEGMSKFLGILAAFYVPPVGVLLKAGVGVPLILNVVLWLLGWFPGVIHALWVICNDE